MKRGGEGRPPDLTDRHGHADRQKMCGNPGENQLIRGRKGVARKDIRRGNCACFTVVTLPGQKNLKRKRKKRGTKSGNGNRGIKSD